MLTKIDVTNNYSSKKNKYLNWRGFIGVRLFLSAPISTKYYNFINLSEVVY